MKNLKEELKRMKSLFNSDRLYGNIINEATNPDTNSDGKIDSTEFSASGDEIDTEEGKLFLKGIGYEKIERDYGEVDSTSDVCMKSPNIRKIVGLVEQKIGSSSFNSYNPIINASNGVCYLSILSPLGNDYQIKKMALWNDNRITFYIDLKVAIDFTNLTEFNKSMPNLSSTPPRKLKNSIAAFSRFLTTKKIKYLRYFADMDINAWTYDSVEFGGFYDEKLNRTAKAIENTIIDEFYYNPGGTSVDVDITQILTNSSYANINLNGSVNNLLNKM